MILRHQQRDKPWMALGMLPTPTCRGPKIWRWVSHDNRYIPSLLFPHSGLDSAMMFPRRSTAGCSPVRSMLLVLMRSCCSQHA
jgi:hypothetical protein